MFDPVKVFEDIATAQGLIFLYGARPFQNWDITQQDITDDDCFLGMFPFRERGAVSNGSVDTWSVLTVLWVGRKFDPAGTLSSLDETEEQKYDRRLKYLRVLMETILQTLCGEELVEVTDAEIFRELNKFDENTDVIGCNLTFTYNPNYDNVSPDAPTATAATNRAATQMIANWNKTNADGYYLDVATDSAFAHLVVTNRDCGNYAYSLITGLVTATTYYYRVRAYNDIGTSGNSNTITAVTL